MRQLRTRHGRRAASVVRRLSMIFMVSTDPVMA
jgi:hypothetical protein